MTITVRRYEPGDAEGWDRFCTDSWQGTFLHSRRFLSYHGERFVDRSLLIEEAGRVVGLFPAAELAGGISSHPGLTYGGVVQAGGLRGERMIEALEAVARHYASGGSTVLRYKAVPALYHRVPAEDDLYALFRLGARRVRCDLSCTIDLANPGRVAERRRRGWRKSQAAGVVVSDDPVQLDRFWEVVESNLARRHQARPVHTHEEMSRLVRLFPTAIRLLVARVADELIAGALLFITPTTVHTQYIAASEEGFRLAGLDAVLAEAIALATRLGCRWFDFGTSNEQDGHYLNEGLYAFKSEFGGGGRVYETYELDLRG